MRLREIAALRNLCKLCEATRTDMTFEYDGLNGWYRIVLDTTGCGQIVVAWQASDDGAEHIISAARTTAARDRLGKRGER